MSFAIFFTACFILGALQYSIVGLLLKTWQSGTAILWGLIFGFIGAILSRFLGVETLGVVLFLAFIVGIWGYFDMTKK
jgi:hypothetical protein